MSNAIDLLEEDVRAGAIAFLSEMAGRDLAAADLAATEPERFDDAVTMARRILQAVDAARAAAPPTPRQTGPLNGADAQALRLDLGADAVVITAWMPGDGAVDIALAASGNRTLARRCASAPAEALAAAIAAALPALSADPAPETSA
ncbi:hypothetical protein [Methylobacterium sp. E-066]|uniref:hypothetical protein n=1 Tax=Methylobacterium sp. E-066 TaxID=2836584 RepID=UPI001FB8C6F3|nr:hypothetical protein [Methylobacterium sp. E-066]MCJ2143676.1 hypothetical protein [Methylobacterium sp. E-066]